MAPMKLKTQMNIFLADIIKEHPTLWYKSNFNDADDAIWNEISLKSHIKSSLNVLTFTKVHNNLPILFIS
jgi:hypothetical protein